MCDGDGSCVVLDLLCRAASEPIEDLDPEDLRALIDTARDLVDRAEMALAAWGPA